MYLSRLILNPRSRRVQSELASPYELHRTLMQGFPQTDGKDPREEFDVLFRVDICPRTNRIAVLVQSAAKPDWTLHARIPGYLVETGGAPPHPDGKSIDRQTEALRVGQTLAFRLHANPAKRSVKGDNKGKRVGLYREEEQVAWLRRKAEACGFDLLQAAVAPEGLKIGRKRGPAPDESHRTKHHAVRFEGVLRIVDADRFRAALKQGIGPGKAFGFGLLSLAPPG